VKSRISEILLLGTLSSVISELLAINANVIKSQCHNVCILSEEVQKCVETASSAASANEVSTPSAAP
jgi:hypothetical protein